MKKSKSTKQPDLPVSKPTNRKARYFGYEFHRDNFRRMTVLVVGLVIADLALVLAMFIVHANFPQRDLYAATRNGLLVRLRQFDSPAQVLAAQAAKAESAVKKAAEKVESENP